MGEGILAQRIVEVAKEEGIPIMQNVPLARALLQDSVENEYIGKYGIAGQERLLNDSAGTAC